MWKAFSLIPPFFNPEEKTLLGANIKVFFKERPAVTGNLMWMNLLKKTIKVMDEDHQAFLFFWEEIFYFQFPDCLPYDHFLAPTASKLPLLNLRKNPEFPEIKEIIIYYPTSLGLQLFHLSEQRKISITLVPTKKIKQQGVLKIGKHLIENEIITENQLEQALKAQLTPDLPESKNKKVGQILLDSGTLSAETLQMAIAEQLQIPFLRLDYHLVDKVAITLIPINLMKEKQLIPLDYIDNTLVVAFKDPINHSLINMLSFMAKCPIEMVLATEEDIFWVIQHWIAPLLDAKDQDAQAHEFHDDIAQIEKQVAEIQEIPDEVLQKETQKGPVIRLVNSIFQDAIHQRASDIHFQPQETGVALVYRVDGNLLPINMFKSKVYLPMLNRIKIIGGMNIGEKRLPQDGRARITIPDQPTMDMRISCIPMVHGESLSLRILDQGKSKRLQEIGMADHERQKLQKALHSENGMVLITGPTGSGKSTTMRAAIEEIRVDNRHIITIEDPVETYMHGIQQIQVYPKIGFTFARALKAILRHDPEVVVLGEMRDQETSEIAVETALTGHLVLSTLHTNSAAKTITRLLDLGLASYLLKDALLAVLAQRLLRRVCPHCREIESFPEEVYQDLKHFLPKDQLFFSGRGCEHCHHTGFRGRIGVHELLIISPAIKEAIQPQTSAAAIESIARSEGMLTLLQNGVNIAIQGLTSLKEVHRVLFQVQD